MKKTERTPWQRKPWCLARITSGDIMCREDVLDVYALPDDPDSPQICLDERPCMLLGDTLVPIPMTPGKSDRDDDHYERHGVCTLFIAVEPLSGFRYAPIRKTRMKEDSAEFMHAVAALPRDANVKGFRLVQDNVNTHTAGSFYQAVEPEEAHRLKQVVEDHYTPTNGSWLNMAELERSAITRQCLDRRIPTHAELEREVLACVKERNAQERKITWQFTTADARKKLKRHDDGLKKAGKDSDS